ncbi:MAG TPA: glycosyltransferase [archaeon]|nr:glycosyltransferase [archaeon]
MGLPEVSVIIPTYNRAHMLADAVGSVHGQLFRDFELIVVDDGSTDDTASVLAASGAGEIKVIKTRRRGVAAARNIGAQAAQGRYLAFLDSDDLWLSEKLEVQLEVHAREPDALLSHTDEIWVRRGVRVNPMKKHAKRGGWIFEYSLPMCRISPSSVLIERRLFQEVGGFDERFCVCEDYELWLRITAHYPVLYIDRKLIVKRGGHSDQLSGSTWGLDRFRVMALEKLLQTEKLTDLQRRAAALELARKAAILSNGYRHRNKLRQAEKYDRVKELGRIEADRLGESAPR